MTEYFVPTGQGEAEYVEKRSHFIGEVYPVESEAQARATIEAVKKKHYDARHHCWCYRLRGGPERYSDDGEPQGTAGQPMLNVFQMEQIENALCVVTRYFGGILLGAGGLVRAYTRAAKDALDAAGTSVVRRWVEVALQCPYARYEQVKRVVEGHGGVLGETEYAADITVRALLSEDKVNAFTDEITELTAGAGLVQILGETDRAAPLGNH